MKDATTAKKYQKIAKVYDFFAGNIFMKNFRKKMLADLQIPKNSKVLLLGVGTGEDLPFFDVSIYVTGIDLSPDMLEKAQKKIISPRQKLFCANGESTNYPDESYDFVILNIVLTVAENPRKMLSEAIRVVKKSGTIVIFDKFLPDDKKISVFRAKLNQVTTNIATDINYKLTDILVNQPVKIVKRERPFYIQFLQLVWLKKS